MFWSLGLVAGCQAFQKPVRAMDVRPVEVPSPKSCAAGVAVLAHSLLSEGKSTRLLDISDLVTRIAAVQRVAIKVMDDDEQDATGVPLKSTALLAALADAANAVERVARRADTAESRQSLGQLEAELRSKYAELSSVLLPLSVMTTINVSTPVRRAAVKTLELAQTTRVDEALVGSRPHISLAAGIDTAERAAQSILLGKDDDNGAAAKVTALATAILLTERVATNIAARGNESAETRSKSSDLAASLRAVAVTLRVRTPNPSGQSQNATGWLWWDELPVLY